jgi:hypothetical protein
MRLCLSARMGEGEGAKAESLPLSRPAGAQRPPHGATILLCETREQSPGRSRSSRNGGGQPPLYEVWIHFRNLQNCSNIAPPLRKLHADYEQRAISNGLRRYIRSANNDFGVRLQISIINEAWMQSNQILVGQCCSHVDFVLFISKRNKMRLLSLSGRIVRLALWRVFI